MDSESKINENKGIINKIQENIATPSIAMITDGRGNILDCNIANSIGKIVELCELTYIAKTISLRLEVTSVHHILGGLELDVNIFKDVFAISTLFDKNRILIIVVPKTINLIETINFVSEITKATVKKIKSELESAR